MTKLVTITLTCPPLNGLYNVTTINCNDPDVRIRGWRAFIRGPAVFLVSPRGWKLSTPEALFDSNGPRRVYEIPRASCIMQWSSDDELVVDKLQKFDSDPFMKSTPIVVAVPDEPDDEEALERATAPTPKIIKK